MKSTSTQFTGPWTARCPRSRTGALLLALFAMFFCLFGTVQASHYAGYEYQIDYIAGSTNSYRITAKVYRDCRGISLANPASSQLVRVATGTTQNLSMPRTSLIDITPLCPGQTSPCPNSPGIFGLEEHIFQLIVTNLVTNENYRVQSSNSARNGAITTGAANQLLFIEANFRTGLGNSSPRFLNRPVGNFCANQPAVFSPNGFDPDGDAILYSMTACRQSLASSATYAPGFSFTNPVSSSTGVNLNPNTGALTFTPTNVGQVAIICVRADEYRNGTLIGSVVRDMQINIVNCNNAPPVIAPLPNVVVNVGQTYCVPVNATDANNNLITLSAVSGIIPPGTFVQNTSSAGSATGTFCFTPNLSHVGNTYTVTVNAQDNACPSPGIGSVSFNITVPVPCNMTATASSTPTSCGGGTGSVSVSVTNGTAPITYSWTGPNGYTSFNASNTGLIAGTYDVLVVDGNSCVANATVVVSSNGSSVVATGTATPASCNQSNGTLTVSVSGGTPPYQYSLNGGAFGASNTFTGLATGNYTFAVMDANGCPASGTAAVGEARDVTAPVISCPANISVGNDPGVCGAAVSFNPATATDDCGLATVVQTSGGASGSVFGTGTTTVSFTAVDNSGNVASCSFTITVTDNEAPAITCPANVTVSNDPGLCGAAVNYNAASATDNCPGVSVAQTSGGASGSVFAVGTTTNSFTAVDASGNTAACSFTVTVNDTEAPTVSCGNAAGLISRGLFGGDSLLGFASFANDVTLANDGGVCGAVYEYDNEVTDNCPNFTLVQTSGLPSGSTFPVGATTNTFLATDGSGNTSECSFVVTVVDAEAPVISCPASVTVNNDGGVCGAAVNYTVSSSDNCPGETVAQVGGLSSGSVFPVGTTSNSFTVVDASGNQAACSFTVTVVDAEAPAIVCPASSTVSNDPGVCGAAVNYAVSSSDNCAGETVAQTSGLASGSVFPVGTTSNSFVATDAAGNTAACSFSVTVNDTEAPSITCPANVTVSCVRDIPAANTALVSASDNCGVTGVSHVGDVATGTGCAGNARVVVRTYSVSDIHGNTASCTQTLTAEATPVVATASNDVVVFPLYADSACATISVVGAGGCAPLTYAWSNGSTATSQNVCPTTSTTYYVTVTDAQGCTGVDSVRVCAIDLRCSGGTNNGQGGTGQGGNGSTNGNGIVHIAICHIPPGNVGNAMVHCIPAPAARQHLLQGHGGDYLGACGSLSSRACTSGNNKMAAQPAGNETLDSKVSMNVFPNPTNGALNVEVACSNCGDEGIYKIKVTDIYGKQFYAAELNVALGEGKTKLDLSRYAAGVYMVIVENGNQRIVERVVKN